MKKLWQRISSFEEEPDNTPPHIPDWVTYVSIVGAVWYVCHVVSRIVELYF